MKFERETLDFLLKWFIMNIIEDITKKKKYEIVKLVENVSIYIIGWTTVSDEQNYNSRIMHSQKHKLILTYNTTKYISY